MSLATMTLVILFFVNLGFFLLSISYPVQFSTINSPMISIFLAFAGQSINWASIITPAVGAEIAVIMGAILIYALVLNPSGVVTGQPFTITLLPLMIAISFFVAFVAIPNFSVIGIPYPLDIVVESIFGMLVGISIFGLFRGE